MEQTVTFKFNIEQINVILRALDQMPHVQVRQLIDLIISEGNRQQQELRAKIAEAEAKVAEQAKAEVE